MNFKILFDKNQEEDLIIIAKEKNEAVEKIEEILINENSTLLGFNENYAEVLKISQIHAFICENSKIYALTDKEKFKIKYRLYQLEEKLPRNFIKINQSNIANINMIENFSATLYGTLAVKFKNGYTDYVSRRNIKKVKERLGLKKWINM